MENVIFLDESKYNILGSDGKGFSWRKPNTEDCPKNLRATVKRGFGNVMIWGCMAYSGVGNIVFIDDTMTVTSYIEVLRDILRFSASILGLSDTYHFQQDNDPKHTTWDTKMWLLYNVPKRLNTPPQSTDMNLIENLWQILDLKVRK